MPFSICFTQTYLWFVSRYHSRTLYIIDVSQSVEHDHPHASEFLRKDLANVTDYFGKKGVRVMSLMDLFTFVTDASLGTDDAAVDRALEQASTISVVSPLCLCCVMCFGPALS